MRRVDHMIDHRGLTTADVEWAVIQYLTSQPEFMGGELRAEEMFQAWYENSKGRWGD